MGRVSNSLWRSDSNRPETEVGKWFSMCICVTAPLGFGVLSILQLSDSSIVSSRYSGAIMKISKFVFAQFHWSKSIAHYERILIKNLQSFMHVNLI